MARWVRNHRCEQPGIVAFVDTETYFQEPFKDHVTGQHYLRLGCATVGRWDGSDISGREDFTFRDASVFWTKLLDHCSSKKVAWLFAHNILFDLWILDWPSMLQTGQSIIARSPHDRKRRGKSPDKGIKPWQGLCTIEHGCTIMQTITHGRRINFIDTLNYYRCSVAELGKSIELPKLDMPGFEADDSKVEEYCRRDCDIITLAMTTLMREWRANDLGNWQPTAASLAFSSYRHRFAPLVIVPHNDPDASVRERAAYYDGRTQPLMIGDYYDPSYHLDVSSLYPSVMRDSDYPFQCECDSDGQPLLLTKVTPQEVTGYMRDYCVVAGCELATDRAWYPYRHDNRVIYPTGRFWTSLCTPELEIALTHNHVVKFNWCMLYRRAKLFTRWVDYWWERRQHLSGQGNYAGAEVCKVLMNSLAGKLGQKARYWVNALDVAVPEPWSSWVYYDATNAKATPCRSIGWTAQKQIDAGDSVYALVASAAHVASYARVKMLAAVLSCPQRSVRYIGNDGLIVNGDAYATLCGNGSVTQGTLGGLRLTAVYNQLSIYGARDYVADERVVKAGLPRVNKPLGDRRWQADLIESPDAAIQREPDGTVHTRRVVIAGSAFDPTLMVDSDGVVLQPRVENGLIVGKTLARYDQPW